MFIVFPGVRPNPKRRVKLKVRVCLRSLRRKKILINTTFRDFSLDVYDDIHILHLVSDSWRLSFSQELTPTLPLGLSLGLELSWGHFEDKKSFHQHNF